MKKMTQLGNFLTLTFLSLLIPGQALAAFPSPVPITITDPGTGLGTDLGDIVNTAIRWAIYLGAVVALFYLAWGAFQYLTAGDDMKATEKGRARITNAVVGLVILASIFAIWTILATILNLGEVGIG